MTKKKHICTVWIVLLLIFSLGVHINTQGDDPEYIWDDIAGFGIPYLIELEIGEDQIFGFHLKEDREYVFYLYGEFLTTGTDYDMELHDSNSLIQRATASAGQSETIEYKPTSTGDYKIIIENDPRESEGEFSCKLVALETISPNEKHKVTINGAINDNGDWDPQLYTYYAFLFDARDHTNKTFEVTLSTPNNVDMYQMRLYKRPTKEIKIGSEYDALASYSEYALLSDDAPTVGDDLHFNLTIPTQSGYEIREKGIFYADYFIIELIGERGDGTCKLLIEEIVEEQQEDPENGNQDPPEESPPENTPEESPPEQTTPETNPDSTPKDLTTIQIVTGITMLFAFIVMVMVFLAVLLKR